MSVLTEQIPLNVVINVTNKTITFTDYTTINLRLLKSIANDTLGSFIYTLGTASAVGASVSGNVLTLPTMPAAMANTDVLVIQYLNQANDPVQQAPLLPTLAARDGTDATAAVAPTGAVGIRGWLSSIYTSLINNLFVVGNIPSGSTDSGNPVKVAGRFNSTIPTYSDGQRGDLQLDGRGALRVSLWQNSSTNTISFGPTNADSVAVDTGSIALRSLGYSLVYNGTTYDRQRSANGATAAGTGTPAATLVPSAGALALLGYLNNSVLAAPQTVKASAGRLHKVVIDNTNTAKVYLQVFDALVANVTVGTTVPRAVYPVPASGIFEDQFLLSDSYATGIAIAVTTTPGGSTAPTTGCMVNLGYI